MASALKRLTLPGFENVPIYKVLELLFEEIQSPILILRAKAIAYSFFLALFPMMLFMFSLLASLPMFNLSNDILGYLKNILPDEDMVEFFVPMVNEILTNPPIGIMSIGFLMIILFMKSGVITMMQSFNIHHNTFSGKILIKNQILAIIITLIILFLFIMTIILIVLGKTIMTEIFDFFDYDGKFLVLLINILRYIISIFLNFLVISILYYLGPLKRPKQFKILTPGSIVATTMIIIVSYLFSNFIINFSNYNKLYGSMGTILFTLIWLYWNAMSILIGYEMNRSIDLLNTKRHRNVSKK